MASSSSGVADDLEVLVHRGHREQALDGLRAAHQHEPAAGAPAAAAQGDQAREAGRVEEVEAAQVDEHPARRIVLMRRMASSNS